MTYADGVFVLLWNRCGEDLGVLWFGELVNELGLMFTSVSAGLHAEFVTD